MRTTWKRLTLAAALCAALVSAAPRLGDSQEIGALLGSGPIQDGAMVGCGVCVGGAIFLTLSGTWVEFLGLGGSWAKIGGCVGSCYATFM